MNGRWALAIVIAACTAALFGGGIWLVRQVRRVSRMLFGVDSFLEGIEKRSLDYAARPKSVNGMTRTYLPLIARDFPDFNYREFRQKAENMLLSAFLAMDEQTPEKLVNASPDLRQQVALRIAQDQAAGLTTHFARARIHETVIARYVKQDGTCAVTLQSSVEYVCYTEDADGTVVSGEPSLLTQTRYNTELVYVQDADKLAGKARETALGVNCPNCGAPVRDTGRAVCEYCGSRIVPININVWRLNRFTEV